MTECQKKFFAYWDLDSKRRNDLDESARIGASILGMFGVVVILLLIVKIVFFA